jgi:hypothetical protein
MILLFSMLSTSLAGDVLGWPTQPAPVVDECVQSVSITYGQPPPSALFKSGVATCNAVAEPTSSLTYLLAVEKYQKAADELHLLNVQQLETQRDWYKAQYQQQVKPQKWINRPVTQRWIGRVEALVVCALVAGIASAAYNHQAKG